MKKLLILLFLSPGIIFSQTPDPLALRGTVTMSGTPAEGVTLELTKSGKKITTVITPVNGSYNMNLPQSTTDKNNEYILTISKEGTVTQTFSINTYVLETYSRPGTIPQFPLNIPLIATPLKNVVLHQPSGKIKYIFADKAYGLDKTYDKTVQKENAMIAKDPEKYFSELKKKDDEEIQKKLKVKADSTAAYEADKSEKTRKEANAARAKMIADSIANSQIKKITYDGKLLAGTKEKEPLKNQKVTLMDNKKVEVQSTITDKYGDFSFKDVSTNRAYTIEVPDNGQKIKDGQLFLARQDGTIVSSLKKSGGSFVYELLPTELNTLAKVKEEDPGLKIMNFSSSKQTEITVIENIYYAQNSAEINKEAIVKLDKIINAMQKNKTIKLAIVSHTDSKGDDASNMILSEKRSQKVLEYFLSKGIGKDRLSAKGFGETQIKNRCKNSIDCSEKEHELNRRTEFKFSK